MKVRGILATGNVVKLQSITTEADRMPEFARDNAGLNAPNAYDGFMDDAAAVELSVKDDRG